MRYVLLKEKYHLHNEICLIFSLLFLVE